MSRAKTHVIIRRLIFVVPAMFGRLVFVGCCFAGWGVENGKAAWRATQ